MAKLRLTGFLVLGIVFLLDQLSKWFVLERYFDPERPIGFLTWLYEKQAMRPFEVDKIFDFFNIVIVWNAGISFGLFAGANEGEARSLLLIGVAVVISLFFLYWLWRSSTMWQAVATGMVIGGALGNIWDRIRFEAVADFLDFHFAGWHYPAFNLADSAITVGILLFIIIHSRNEKAFEA